MIALLASYSAISLLSLIVAFIVLVVTSLTDLKTKEVPDYVSGFAIISGLVFKTFYFALNPDFNLFILFAGIVGLVTTFSLLLYRAGQWGGGDLKLMIGLVLLLPFESLTPLPLMIIFFLAFPFVAGAYGVLGSTLLIARNPRKFWDSFKKKVLRTISIAVIILGFSLFPLREFNFTFPIMVFTAVMYVLLEVVSSSEECMIKKLKVSKLTEGDWVVEEVRVKGKVLFKPVYHGVTLKDIEAFKKAKVKEVTIKDGIPFVPAFLLTFITSLLVKDLVNSFLTRLF